MPLVTLLRRFTIRTRMIGAVVVLLLLLVGIGATGLLSLRTIDRISAAYITKTHADAVELSQLRDAMGNLRRFEKDMLLNLGERDTVRTYEARWREALTAAIRSAQRLADGDADEGTATAARIVRLLTSYRDQAAPVLAGIVDGSATGIGQANQALAGAKRAIHAIDAEVVALVRHLEMESTEADQERQATFRTCLLVFGGVVLVSLLTVAPLTLANMASVCGPIDAARGLAARIATGDLAVQVRSEGADEAAGLLRELAAMQQALRSIVGQVRASADSIQLASAEVAAGNGDLSQRTEITASQLQQSAASIEQLTGSVRHSAQAALQADRLAASASDVAQRGGQVVSQVVSTMDEINQSSRRIADIIGTIDGIAFQTNILALNAAVEAARAGEQGRGFAVVAAEVRSLAQRSAAAAREIKGLIGTSVDRVAAGTRLVQDAGSTMDDIVASVRRVSDVIGEITAATAEQSQGIAQVNGAVGQLDQMTQQNAALVEQSAAAAESLRDQALRLTDVVGRFKA